LSHHPKRVRLRFLPYEAIMNEAALTISATSPAPARARQAAWIIGGLALVILIAVWPYQHWQFESRSSLLMGIVQKALVPHSEWTYCLLPPVIVGWLVWRMRQPLGKLPLAGTWLGAPVLAAGMFFFWFGYKVDTAYPGYLGVQLIMLGLILLLGGWNWLRRLFFPWAFLAFMWPMLPLENMLAVPLRAMTAQASAGVLNAMGIGVVREGTGIFSAADPLAGLAQGDLFKLDVEKPCSGIQSLFALMMISALYGYLALKGWLPRAILFASAIPMAMIGNLVRLVMLAVGCLWLGSDIAVGRNVDGHQEMSTFHLLAGLMVFAVALGGMFLLAKVLQRWRLNRKRPGNTTTATAGSEAKVWAQVAGTALIVGSGLVICAATDTAYRVNAPGVRLDLPTVLGGYMSQEQPMTAKEQSGLNEDVRIERRLYATAERAVLATIVLSGAEKRSLHSPEICLPSQGWIIGTQAVVPVALGNGREARATLITLHRDTQMADGRRVRLKALSLYWYQGSDSTTCATYDEHVAQTYVDAVFRNVNHRWALISFFAPLKEETGAIPDPYAELAALEEVKAFIGRLMPQVLVASETP
jgi:exosortase